MRRVAVCLALLFCIISLLTPVTAELRVFFLDVGQGDAIVLSCDGQTMLIDAGLAEAGPVVNRFLKETLGITELAAVIATHSDDDHIGGMPAALSGLQADTVLASPVVSMFYWFNNVQPVLRQSSLSVSVPEQGDQLTLGDAVLTFLNADDPALSVNNRSCVIRVDYGDTSFLLTGDAESDEELRLLADGAFLKADVIKIGHHGGLGSTGGNFLEAVSPTHAVISVG
ncbi:MAG: MBL fold metallo-hydrolase, partial [Clostridia bacterium]|nr:MBL fold metallo-hydrolase [Clostridia bacterium]